MSEHSDIHLLDLRNHGDSPKSEDCRVEAMAADVAEYVETNRLDEGSVNVLGHSMGGNVAIELLTNPEYNHLFENGIVVDMGISKSKKVGKLRLNKVFKWIEGLSEIDMEVIKSREDLVEEVTRAAEGDKAVASFFMTSVAQTEEG